MKKILTILFLLIIPLTTFGQIPVIDKFEPKNGAFQGLVDENQIIDTLATFGNWLVSDGGYFVSTTTPTDLVTPDMILSTGQTDEFCLTYESTGATYEWQTCGSGGSSEWTFLETFGAVTLTPTSTMPIWSRGNIYASSTLNVFSTSNTNVGLSTGLTLEQQSTGEVPLCFLKGGTDDFCIGIGNDNNAFQISSTNANATGNLDTDIFKLDNVGNLSINASAYDNGGAITTRQKASADAVTSILTLQKDRSGGNGGAGLGFAFDGYLEDSGGGLNQAARWIFKWNDPSNGAEDSTQIFTTYEDGSEVTSLTLTGATSTQRYSDVFDLINIGRTSTSTIAGDNATSTLPELDTTNLQVAGYIDINSDVISDFVGTGLTLNAGSLETTLGTSIDGGTEIVGNSIIESALKISNTGTADYYLSWQTGNTLTWKVLPSGGSGSPGGNDGEIQYNNNTAFGGLVDFTFDGTDFKFASTTEGTKTFYGNDGDYIQQGSGVFLVNAVGDFDLTVTGNINVGSKMILTNSATKPPLNIIARSTAPSSPITADIYLDDGTNTLSARPSLKRYTGSVWEELSGIARTATSTVNQFIERPFNDENKFMFYTDEATTIQQVSSVLVGSSTPTFTFRLYHDTERMGAGNLILIATTTATSTPEIDSSFTDATIPASSFVWLTSTDKSGTIDEFDITISHKID